MLTRLSSQVLGIAALSLLLCLPSQARGVQVGTGVLCDTQKQMERFVALFDGDEENAVNAVNAEANDPSACGFGTIAYVRGPEIATAPSPCSPRRASAPPRPRRSSRSSRWTSARLSGGYRRMRRRERWRGSDGSS